MTIHPEVKSDGYGGWKIVSRIEQISEMISKAGDYRHNCRLLWTEYYRIHYSTGLNKSNLQKVADIKRFLQQCEYAYHKREERLLEELNENKEASYGIKNI